jgi:hypothetical protein
MSDYISSRTVLTVAIGWRFGKREDFAQLRAAAVRFLRSGATFEGQCRGRHYGAGTCNHDQTTAHPYPITPSEAEVEKVTEHRDNYSMGAGNYLSTFGSARGGTGWVFRSDDDRHIDADALPEITTASVGRAMSETDGALLADATTTFHTTADLTQTTATVTPSTMRAGYVEIRFGAKPDETTRAELKRSGFRWALRTACWYGPADRLPERYRPSAAA